MNDPLADLKDIHPPEPMSLLWFPPAPGWWLLALLLLALITATVCWYLFYWKKRACLRAAVTELETLAAASLPSPDLLEAVSALVRRTALAARPTDNLASLQGAAWKEYLVQGGLPEQEAGLVAESRFRATSEPFDTAALLAATRKWIRGQKPC